MNTNVNLLDLELSYLLKTHGFNYHTQYFFQLDSNENWEFKHGDWGGYNEHEDTIACPNAMIVLQYLRNEYNIDVFPCRLSNLTIPNIGYGFMIYFPDSVEPFVWTEPLETFEFAEVKAIEYLFKTNNIFENLEKNEES